VHRHGKISLFKSSFLKIFILLLLNS